jgi:hypothetical protein
MQRVHLAPRGIALWEDLQRNPHGRVIGVIAQTAKRSGTRMPANEFAVERLFTAATPKAR